MTDEHDLVVIYTSAVQLQGSLIKSMLEAEGIPVMSIQEGAGVAHGLVVGPMGEVTLMVPAKYAQAARALLKAVAPDESEEEDEETTSE